MASLKKPRNFIIQTSFPTSYIPINDTKRFCLLSAILENMTKNSVWEEKLFPIDAEVDILPPSPVHRGYVTRKSK